MEQAPVIWRTSSHSGDQGNCVEVAPASVDAWRVRDTKARAGGELTYDATAWAAFIAQIVR